MRQHVLIIDDDEDDCRIIKESLVQIGILSPVEFVLGGKEGLDFLEKNKADLPSLIILDLNMPMMNGEQVLERISDEYGVPVILYTTHCSDELRSKVKALGAIDCVKKGTSYMDNLKFAKSVVDFLRTQVLKNAGGV